MLDSASEPAVQLGLADFRRRVTSAGLEILDLKRPWPNRDLIYCALGKSERRTDIAISDEFLLGLPRQPSYQAAVDSYASALAGRIRCGSPELSYCISGRGIRIEIHWPREAAIWESKMKAWLQITVVDQLTGMIAKCAASLDRFPFWLQSQTVFDDVRLVVNRTRRAVDENVITFYSPGSHQKTYQEIKRDSPEIISPRPQTEVERFLVGKAYELGFRAVDVPGEVWAADPWDAEYLGISSKELSQSAYIVRARGLVELDPTRNFARPADKLLTAAWPGVLDSIGPSEEPQMQLSLSGLPNKERLVADVCNYLKRRVGLALLVIDLDHFKQVNDTKGHPEGDACLQRVVTEIGNVVGRKGTLYRWGGDEFAVFLPDFSTEEAQATAERIRCAVERAKPGADISVTTSIGISASERMSNGSAEELLAAADKAMYASKRQGKNRVTSWPIEEYSEKVFAV